MPFLKIPGPLTLTVPNTQHELISLLQHNGAGRCNVLQHCLNYLLSAAERSDFILKIVPQIIATANKSLELFPNLQLSRLRAGESRTLTFTRIQAGCILSHMFLCTFHPDKSLIHSKSIGDTVDEKPFNSFSPWFSAEPFKRDFDEPDVRVDDPRLAYCRSLIQYFCVFSKMSDKQLADHVTFTRVKLHTEPNWTSFKSTIHKNIAAVSLTGEIGSKMGLEIEFDFANKDIGPGELATQEEIIFGMSPESCIAPLLCDTMQPDEAILVSGVIKVCKSKGYGLSLVAEPMTVEEMRSYNPNKRVIMCLDAMDMSTVPDADEESVSLSYQLQEPRLKRELMKLFTGFGATPPEMPIATGKWGCGVFRGHPGLKSLLQIMTATAVGRQLVFYVFGNKQLKLLIEELLQMYDGKSVSEIWHDLTSMETKNHAKLMKLLNSYTN